MTVQHFDISEASFETFIEFLFDQEVVTIPMRPGPGPTPWYWNAEVSFNQEKTIAFYARLFENPAFLLEKFSKAQLEQGFWAIMSSTLECSITELIWESSLPFEDRADCVRAMHPLYEKLFSLEPLDTSSHMWWDSLAYDWHCGNRARANGGEDALMQDVMFETLQLILLLPSEDSQAAALHGLGHLHHPDTQAVIDKFLEGPVAPSLREYAEAASRFEVM